MSILNTTHSHSQFIPQAIRLRKAANKTVLVLGRMLSLIVFRRLANLGVSDLEEHIKFEVDFTPLSWRKRYNLMKGSTHGLCHNLTQLGYFRPHNRHSRYRNLYFVGASTHPGTGMPTAMVSGRLAANRILDDFRN